MLSGPSPHSTVVVIGPNWWNSVHPLRYTTANAKAKEETSPSYHAPPNGCCSAGYADASHSRTVAPAHWPISGLVLEGELTNVPAGVSSPREATITESRPRVCRRRNAVFRCPWYDGARGEPILMPSRHTELSIFPHCTTPCTE